MFHTVIAGVILLATIFLTIILIALLISDPIGAGIFIVLVGIIFVFAWQVSKPKYSDDDDEDYDAKI